jgi:3-phenylpropionate/cinnamic acid dioxygenase small subunit
MSAAPIGEAAAQLLDEYVERIDSDRLEEWLELFTEDASYQVLPRENLEQDLPASIILCTNKKMLRDRIVSLRNANLYNPHYDRHLVSGVRVKAESEGVWQLTANYAVYQSTHEGQSKLFSVGGYRDKVRMEGGRLLFSKKLVIVDTFAVPSLLATPL